MKNKIQYAFESDVYGGIEYQKEGVVIHLHKDLPFYASLFEWVRKHEEGHAQDYFSSRKSGRRFNNIDLIDSFRILLPPVVSIEFMLFWMFHSFFLLRWAWKEFMFCVTGKEISLQNA